MNVDNMDRTWFLLSLYEKKPYEYWIQELHEMGNFRFLATSGTADWLRDQKIPCKTIAETVGLNSRLEGKIKTLHPDLYTGIMAQTRDDLDGSIPYIEGVCVDLTPFRQDDSFRPGKIDIGGPSLLRASVKSWEQIDVISSPSTANTYLDLYPTDESDRKQLARKTLETTLSYDRNLLPYLQAETNEFESSQNLNLQPLKELRYGENPSQNAVTAYDVSQKDEMPYSVVTGDGLSYTNCLDVEAARRLTHETDHVEVSVIKHSNPTGWARGEELRPVIENAWSGDPKSAFGSIIGVNQTVTEDAVNVLDDHFIEGFIAPDFSDLAIDLLDDDDTRALCWNREWDSLPDDEVINLSEHYLIQDFGADIEEEHEWNVVGDITPTEEQNIALRQMWRICRWVTSNAAVLGTKNQVLGVGAGQQSRVDAVKLAVSKFEEHHGTTGKSLVLASDGFFPFPDNVEVAAKAGIDAIISPGGSVKDQEVLEAAKRHGISMVFTGTRGFYH